MPASAGQGLGNEGDLSLEALQGGGFDLIGREDFGHIAGTPLEFSSGERVRLPGTIEPSVDVASDPEGEPVRVSTPHRVRATRHGAHIPEPSLGTTGEFVVVRVADGLGPARGDHVRRGIAGRTAGSRRAGSSRPRLACRRAHER